MKVHFATRERLGDLQRLLQSADLPFDIQNHIQNFVVVEDKEDIVGCAGLEIYGDVALLRSVAVQQAYRNRGLGKLLVEEMLQHGIRHGVRKVYLLTTTAEAFFRNFGFRVLHRNAAPETIRNTAEFASLCPETAVLMLKELT